MVANRRPFSTKGVFHRLGNLKTKWRQPEEKLSMLFEYDTKVGSSQTGQETAKQNKIATFQHTKEAQNRKTKQFNEQEGEKKKTHEWGFIQLTENIR